MDHLASGKEEVEESYNLYGILLFFVLWRNDIVTKWLDIRDRIFSYRITFVVVC